MSTIINIFASIGVITVGTVVAVFCHGMVQGWKGRRS